MTTVAQFIEYLSQLNQEAEVRVLYSECRGYGISTGYEDIEIGEYSNNLDACHDVVYLGWDKG